MDPIRYDDALTVNEHIDLALTQVSEEMLNLNPGDEAGRDFVIAKTHLEDAAMRVNVAWSRMTGRHALADVQRLEREAPSA